MHCQGRAVWSRGGESSRLDVEQLKGEMGQGEVEPSRIYAGLPGWDLMYGPGFQSITGMRCGRGQVLAQLRLPGMWWRRSGGSMYCIRACWTEGCRRVLD